MLYFKNSNEEQIITSVLLRYGQLGKIFKKGKYILYKRRDKTGKGRYTTTASSGTFTIEKIEKITDKTVNSYHKKSCFCITKQNGDENRKES
jgi:hypothetical protein